MILLGAGKSYTMLGAGEKNPAEFGLIPRVCFNLFEYFETMAQEKGVRCSMEFSFLQIYNENLRDCLAPNTSTILKGNCHISRKILSFRSFDKAVVRCVVSGTSS